MKKRLGIIYAGFLSRGGGVVTHAKNIKNIFEAKGYAVDIWSLDNKKYIGYFLAAIERIGDILIPPLGKYLRWKITKVLLRYSIDDLVTSNDFVIFEDPYSFNLKYVHNTNSIFFIHGARSNYLGDVKRNIPFFYKMLVNYEKECLLKIRSKGIFILDEQKKYLEERYHCKFEGQVINNVLDIDKNIVSKYIKWEDRRYLTFIGLLNKIKNPEFIIEIARKIKTNNACGYQIIIIGDGPLKEKIQELIEKYKLEKLVKITGMIEHEKVMTCLNNTKYLLLPSFSEGLPFVLIEGKLMGCYNIINEDLPIPQEFYDAKLKLDPELWVQEILKDQAPRQIDEDDLKEQFSADKHYKEILDALNQK